MNATRVEAIATGHPPVAEERDILKKATAFFAQAERVTFAFILTEKAAVPGPHVVSGLGRQRQRLLCLARRGRSAPRVRTRTASCGPQLRVAHADQPRHVWQSAGASSVEPGRPRLSQTGHSPDARRALGGAASRFRVTTGDPPRPRPIIWPSSLPLRLPIASGPVTSRPSRRRGMAVPRRAARPLFAPRRRLGDGPDPRDPVVLAACRPWRAGYAPYAAPLRSRMPVHERRFNLNSTPTGFGAV